ncbi:MAG: hypothetical protein LZ168_07615 [Thaumarchaeota archaeon]|nr:hypothetical protein [Candidatus Geocrenenecus arthurdayi]
MLSPKSRVIIMVKKTVRVKSRKKKNIHKTTIAVVGLLLFLFTLIFLTTLNIPSSVSQHTILTTYNAGIDKFHGNIINNVYYSGLGIVIADRDCRTGSNGLTTCTGVIKTDRGDIVEFKYTHDMSTQPCLSPGDRVQIISEQDSKATVVRLG